MQKGKGTDKSGKAKAKVASSEKEKAKAASNQMEKAKQKHGKGRVNQVSKVSPGDSASQMAGRVWVLVIAEEQANALLVKRFPMLCRVSMLSALSAPGLGDCLNFIFARLESRGNPVPTGQCSVPVSPFMLEQDQCSVPVSSVSSVGDQSPGGASSAALSFDMSADDSGDAWTLAASAFDLQE